MLKLLLGVDVFLILAGLGLIYLKPQIETLGSRWRPFIIGKLETDTGLPWFQSLGTSVYHFSFNQQVYRFDVGTYRQIFYVLLLSLLIIELLLLLKNYRKLSKKNKALLKPLVDLSSSTASFSEGIFDEEKFHELKNAIDALKPGENLSKTDDKELLDLENAINKLIQRTHESYQQQLRFVSDASHELRTPIAIIQGYADLLARWGKSDPVVLDESINALVSESKQMQYLVEQLLFLARGDSGHLAFSAEKLDLSSLLKETAEEYQMIQKERVWKILAEDEVPCYGDPALLKQLLRILIDNAIRYSEGGSQITLSAERDEAGVASFSVTDEGIGIKSENLPLIFDRFYRVDPSRSRSKGGSGLGLSIAKWIVDRHQGWFEIVSYENIGTRITVNLPPELNEALAIEKSGQSENSGQAENSGQSENSRQSEKA